MKKMDMKNVRLQKQIAMGKKLPKTGNNSRKNKKATPAKKAKV
jgi:hypothetical protein